MTTPEILFSTLCTLFIFMIVWDLVISRCPSPSDAPSPYLSSLMLMLSHYESPSSCFITCLYPKPGWLCLLCNSTHATALGRTHCPFEHFKSWPSMCSAMMPYVCSLVTLPLFQTIFFNTYFIFWLFQHSVCFPLYSCYLGLMISGTHCHSQKCSC